jgi:hypothetical protein
MTPHAGSTQVEGTFDLTVTPSIRAGFVLAVARGEPLGASPARPKRLRPRTDRTV